MKVSALPVSEWIAIGIHVFSGEGVGRLGRGKVELRKQIRGNRKQDSLHPPETASSLIS